MGRAEHTFSTRDSVGTPREVYEPIIHALGPIGLDPCSHPGSVVQAAVRYYLPQYAPAGMAHGTPVSLAAHGQVPAHVAVVGDGLELPWGPLGLVYVNPPYSRLSEEGWILRGASTPTSPASGKNERKRTPAPPGRADEVVWLLPVRTAGSWWQRDLVTVADTITFLRFRVQHTGEQDPSPFHQALAYRGPRHEAWAKFATRELGWTVRPK